MHFLTLIIKFCLTLKFLAVIWDSTVSIYLASTHFSGLKIYCDYYLDVQERWLFSENLKLSVIVNACSYNILNYAIKRIQKNCQDGWTFYIGIDLVQHRLPTRKSSFSKESFTKLKVRVTILRLWLFGCYNHNIWRNVSFFLWTKRYVWTFFFFGGMLQNVSIAWLIL